MLSAKTPERGAPDFDRLARVYRWMEYLSFGPALSRCRTEFIPDLAHCRNALVLGDGDGRFTARLLAANPAVQVHAIDASPAMLRALVHHAGKDAAHVHTEVADARAWQPANSNPYDLIATHFFLDCLTTAEIRMLAERIHSATASNALWVISEFAVPRSFFGRIAARPLVATLYRAFGLLTGLEVRSLPDHARALSQAGFKLVHRRTRWFGLLVSECWSAGCG
jgi:SAM-dependent methyltransferase